MPYTKTLSPKRIRDFQEYIFNWWKTNRRDLPWRNTSDPYRVLVSEIMLQQTQVSRVLPSYTSFLTAFPDIQSLADAPASSVLRHWKGLGYNRRALFLKKMAEVVRDTYDNRIPSGESELLALPGIGKYTARAIMVFAFRTDTSMVDTNIRSIVTHFFYDDIPQTPGTIERTAEILVPMGKSWDWHQALMDFGSSEMVRIRRKSGISVAPKGKKAIPFKNTNRFLRGRIIDELREHAYPVEDFIRMLTEKYEVSERSVRMQITSLASERLVSSAPDGVISLPD